MKLLVITREFPPKVIGGLGYHLGYLYQEISKEHDLTIIAGECKEKVYDENCPTPEDADIKWANYGSIKGYQIRYPLALRKKLKQMNISRFDVAFVHTEIPFNLEIPTVSKHHDSKRSSREYTRQSYDFVTRIADQAIHPYRKWIEQRTLDISDHHIFISNVCKAGWKKHYNISSPTSIIHNGVDRDLFYPRDVKNDNSILFVGDNERKGLSKVLDFAESSKRTVKIVGNIDSNLDNVDCVGRVSQNRLAELYSKASVTVHPANFEAFGNVVLESLSCGTPAVVSPECGAGEVLTDKSGVVTHELNEGVKICSNFNSEDCVEVAKKYTWDDVASRTINIAQNVIQN